ncbi:RNA polymerase sigma factor SigF [Mycolicibacterium sarraceniae]|uniref:RNA polymerase sigma factor SigF n=1 Tax=Mycolicibacterium sarraceniae TaxID=1534348 RepID=A0A7I7SXE8_9MYCO|nr:RNA polymerase sigma factor SigF [Mycolicibacterium sarraceniae]
MSQPVAERESEYADVLDLFRHLATLDADTVAFQRQRDAIVARCLPLADHIARRFANRGEPLEDLVQVARVGLMQAVKRFDVETGSDFLSFAVPTMMGEVRRYFRDHSWSLKVPRRLKDLTVQLNRGRSELSQTLGRAPTATELANHLGMDRQEIVDGLVAASAYGTQSTDVPVRADDGQRPLSERLGSVDPNMENVLNVETVRPLLAALPERERTVLVLRFFENMTQSQIAEQIGVSQMHVSRILSKAIAGIRKRMEDAEAASPTLPISPRRAQMASRDIPGPGAGTVEKAKATRHSKSRRTGAVA